MFLTILGSIEVTTAASIKEMEVAMCRTTQANIFRMTEADILMLQGNLLQGHFTQYETKKTFWIENFQHCFCTFKISISMTIQTRNMNNSGF